MADSAAGSGQSIMETATEATPSSKPGANRWRRPWVVRTALVVAALLTIVVWSVVVSKREEFRGFTWMTVSEAKQSVHQNPLRQLGNTIMNLSGPIGRWLGKPKSLVEYDYQFFILSTNSFPLLGNLGFTNANGMRAWILTPEQLRDLDFNLASAVNLLGGSWQRETTRVGGGQVLSTAIRSQGVLRYETLFRPRIVSGSLDILVGATAAESAPQTVSGMKTNLAVACRALVPSGGGLMLEDVRGEAVGEIHLFLMSAAVLDAKGNRRVTSGK